MFSTAIIAFTIGFAAGILVNKGCEKKKCINDLKRVEEHYQNQIREIQKSFTMVDCEN